MKEEGYPKYRWFVLFAMGMIVVAQGIVLIAPAPMVGVIAEKTNMTLGQATGGTMGLFTIIVAIVSIACGPVIDKLRSARSRVVSLVLMLLGTVLTPVMGDSFGGLLVCRAIQAIGAGFTMGSLAIIASEWFPPDERSLAVGLQGTGQAIGISLGFALIPAAFAGTGNLLWSLTLSTTILLIVGAILGLIVLFGPKPPDRTSVQSSSARASKGLFKLALATPVTWVAIVGGALMSWVYMAFNDLTPGYLAVDPPVGIGLGPVGAGQVMIGAQISFMLGCALCGIIIEKLFRGSTKRFLFICTIGSTICVYAVKIPAVYSSQQLLFGAIVLAGFFLGVPITAAVGFLAKYYPNEISGTIGGLGMGVIILLGATGLNVNAYLLHATGFYFSSITLIAVLSIVSFVISLFLNPPRVFQKGSSEVAAEVV